MHCLFNRRACPEAKEKGLNVKDEFNWKVFLRDQASDFGRVPLTLARIDQAASSIREGYTRLFPRQLLALEHAKKELESEVDYSL